MKSNVFLNYAMLLLMAALSACAVPKPSFTYAGPEEAPSPISFKNTSPKPADSYVWDFGDGNTSTEAAPVHTFFASGSYAVKLTAKKGSKTKTYEDKISIKAPKVCLVMIETDFGNMLVRLSDATPKHRDNFLKLAEQGYFDGTLFHRVISGFMIQGGDPNSKNAKPGQQLGMGGPNYTIEAEFVDSLAHIKGAIAAAHTGNPQKRSSGSQFYIVHGSPVSDAQLNEREGSYNFRYSKAQRDAYAKLGGYPPLDREYTVFGQVIQGLDVIDKIAAQPTLPGNRPKSDVKMKVRVIK
ncbi:peptidyl-prolyl cis-trans isomerase cyclophilin type [Haliscomenobacter hydrossis DSM 1100]|uniref:Peptidyl-prolyl cis-trans isomerase n=2 Tax=Haliscomenobacter TaxID=2349 RepID=F4KRT0_HALH1|nr:peptidyl-prolyl cis-trans isomerase cyclophilin type [Haliscomenobacter hydrossis DSM 1100]